MRPELPPKFSLSTGSALALLLAALIATRAGYIEYAWEAAPISPAFADGHRSSGSSRESEGGGSTSSSARSSEGDSSGSSGGGQRDSGGSGSNYTASGGGDGGGQRGGDGYTYSGYGVGNGTPGYGNGSGYSGYGGSGYTYSGHGGTPVHGDGRPPSVGIPQPELKGLPKELRLDLGKDSKSWENLLKDKVDSHLAVKEAGHAPDAKGAEERASHDQTKGWTPIQAPAKGGNSRLAGGSRQSGGNGIPVERDPRSYSQTEVLAANLSPAGAARARALGFQVSGPGQGPGSGQGPGGGHGHGPGGVSVMTLPPGMDPGQGMRLLQQNLPGEQFQPNNIYRLYQPAMKQDGGGHSASVAVLGEKKCGGDRCYAQEAIQWQDRFSSCARNVKIGVIDTGFDLKHPAFKGQKIAQKAFLPAGKSPASVWHGTGVLALLAGRPDSGTPGLVPDATYHAASIFYADDGGDPVTDTVSFMKALDWMSDSGVRLVNMSFSGPRDELVQRKIEILSARGLVFTAAAGNEGPAAEPAYPAAYPQVIAVTAVTKDLRNYPYANRGAHIDVAAPGVDIWTAWPEAQEGYRSGTSFAAPFVAGVLAVYPPDVLRGSKDSLLEHVNVTDLGPPGRDPIYGRGLLQAPPACQRNASEIAELGAGTR